MVCPRCGKEMTLDTHRKYPLNMCYECGYMEGRNFEPINQGMTNFEKLKAMNFNEMVSFLSEGLHMDSNTIADFLDNK